jgi:hypothetical protein
MLTAWYGVGDAHRGLGTLRVLLVRSHPTIAPNLSNSTELGRTGHCSIPTVLNRCGTGIDLYCLPAATGDNEKRYGH